MDFTLHLAVNLPHLNWAAVGALGSLASAAIAYWHGRRPKN